MPLEHRTSDFYRIAVLTRPQAPTELARVFEQILKVHRTDAMQLSRHAPGLLPETFSADQALVLTAAIRGAGLEACRLRPEEVPDLNAAWIVHHVRCIESGLQIFELHGRPDMLIPWPALQMICIGEVPLETFRHYQSDPMTGFTAGQHYRPSSIETRRTAVLECWITCRAPFPILRIAHQQMNYEYLGERKTDSAAVNFRCFIDDLLGHAPDVGLTSSTRAYLNHGSQSEYGFSSSDDLQHFATWQAILAQTGSMDGAAGGGAPVADRGAGETASAPSVIYHCLTCGKVVEQVRQPVPVICCHQPMEIAVVQPAHTPVRSAT